MVFTLKIHLLHEYLNLGTHLIYLINYRVLNSLSPAGKAIKRLIRIHATRSSAIWQSTNKSKRDFYCGKSAYVTEFETEREILASRSRTQSCRNRVLWLQRFIADECVFNFKSSLKWFIHLILFFSPSRLAEMWNHLQGPASCSLGRPYFTMFSLYRAHFFIVHIYDYDIVKNYALIWLWWCKVCMCAGHKFASDSWVKA